MSYYRTCPECICKRKDAPAAATVEASIGSVTAHTKQDDCIMGGDFPQDKIMEGSESHAE